MFPPYEATLFMEGDHVMPQIRQGRTFCVPADGCYLDGAEVTRLVQESLAKFGVAYLFISGSGAIVSVLPAEKLVPVADGYGYEEFGAVFSFPLNRVVKIDFPHAADLLSKTKDLQVNLSALEIRCRKFEAENKDWREAHSSMMNHRDRLAKDLDESRKQAAQIQDRLTAALTTIADYSKDKVDAAKQLRLDYEAIHPPEMTDDERKAIDKEWFKFRDVEMPRVPQWDNVPPIPWRSMAFAINRWIGYCASGAAGVLLAVGNNSMALFAGAAGLSSLIVGAFDVKRTDAPSGRS